jgi:hypothetical protein
MKKLFQRILTILIIPLMLIGGVNYHFDPDYTLRKDYIAPLAKALLEGKMISGPVNVNSRLLKKEWISQLPGTPEVLVLGSSHTLALSQQVFSGKSFINASVSNCTFQDMYAFLELFERKDRRLPKTIIICTDQWLFGNSFVEKQWLENKPEFMAMAKQIDLPLNKIASKWDLDKEWIKELFSVRYLARSLRSLGKTEKFEICSAIDKEKMMFLPDGSRYIPERVVNTPENNISEIARNYFYSSKDEYFTELDQLQCRLFSGMINHLKNRNCTIILFIPPYHPETFQLLEKSEKTSGIFKAESYLQTFARENKLKLIGGSNPNSLNLGSTDFYDAVHLKPESLNTFFKSNSIY